MAFFEEMPCGVGAGVPTGAGLVDGEVDQGPWLQERVGGGVGAMAVPNKGKPPFPDPRPPSQLRWVSN